MLIIAVMVSCSSETVTVSPPEQSDSASESEKVVNPLKIGVVTDVGEIDDQSFNQSSWEGALAAAKSTGGSARYVETQNSKDYYDNILEFVENNYDVVITVGYALGEDTFEVAKKYPHVFFIGVDQFQTEPLPNLVGLVFHEDQAGYLAGVLAAHLTKSNFVASVLGADIVPPVVAFGEGFEAGVKSVNPDINTVNTYHPGGVDTAFTDPEWGASAAAQAMDQGADIIFAAAGKTGSGALIEAAQHEGVYCIGVDTDQWNTSPGARPCLVSSAVKRINLGVQELIELTSHGEFKVSNHYGEVGLADFHDFEDDISDELKAELAKIATGLKSGEIETGYNP